MSDSNCLVGDVKGAEFNLDDTMSDLNAYGVYEDLRQCGLCLRFMPMPDGWDIPKVVHVLSVISRAINGQVHIDGLRSEKPFDTSCGYTIKRWRFVHVKSGIVFMHGVTDVVIVRDTGAKENLVEGGYTSVYEVLFSDVSEDRGKIVYDTRSFASGALGNYQRNLGVTPASPPPGGPHERHINDMEIIRDEEVNELRDRGVRVMTAPNQDCPLDRRFCVWSV